MPIRHDIATLSPRFVLVGRLSTGQLAALLGEVADAAGERGVLSSRFTVGDSLSTETMGWSIHRRLDVHEQHASCNVWT